MKTYTDTWPTGVGIPIDATPHINREHVDGPVICFTDGQMHWLTPWERLMLWLGLTNAFKIERKRRPVMLAMLGL